MKIWKILGLTAVAAASLYALAACAAKPDAMDDKATASITSYNQGLGVLG
jgi:starvation-inducible outer membrane lipoprotein